MVTESSLEPNLPEHPKVTVRVGPEAGDSTETVVILKADAGCWECSAKADEVVLKCSGSWEREGLIRALEFAARQLRAG